MLLFLIHYKLQKFFFTAVFGFRNQFTVKLYASLLHIPYIEEEVKLIGIIFPDHFYIFKFNCIKIAEYIETHNISDGEAYFIAKNAIKKATV